jgi:hypothetical protein
MTLLATLVDAHAYLHACFALESFLDGACEAFRRAATDRGGPLDCGVLLLAQTAGDERFEHLAETAAPHGSAPEGGRGWAIARTGEPESLMARRADGARLLLVCGRQIRAAEGLELLALATCARFADGQPIAAALRAIEAAGALPVLPWGVGKWTGRRGRIVAGLIDAGRPGLACGDNANRPRLWPEPGLLRRARSRGLRVLPGSDPLPLPSEAGRAGRFGFALDGALDANQPARDLARRLADPRTQIIPYGRLESPWRFASNQALLRVRGCAARPVA